MNDAQMRFQLREEVLSQLDMTRDVEDEEVNKAIERQIHLAAKEHYISLQERNGEGCIPGHPLL